MSSRVYKCCGERIDPRSTRVRRIPSFMTAMRSANVQTTAMLCVTNAKRRLCSMASFASNSRIDAATETSRAETNSSQRRNAAPRQTPGQVEHVDADPETCGSNRGPVPRRKVLIPGGNTVRIYKPRYLAPISRLKTRKNPRENDKQRPVTVKDG
jgi:hypothetical protein